VENDVTENTLISVLDHKNHSVYFKP